MKSRAGSIVVLAGLLTAVDLAACGDKFLVVGRGTRFQRGPEAARPYAVLIYAPPSSPLAGPRQASSVEKALVRAGYRLATAGSAGELAESLKSGPPDVVVASAGDARDVEQNLGRQSGSVVLLKSSMSANSVLDAVDDAVDRLVQARKATGRRP